MSESNETTTMNLSHDFTTLAGGQKHVFKAGQNVIVPKNMADDLARRDHDVTQYELGLMKKRTYEVNGGTFPVGSGAQ